MSKPVEVIQTAPDEWIVAIREHSNTTINFVTIPIRGAKFDVKSQSFTPTNGRRTFSCGQGSYQSEIKKFHIVGRNISKATTTLFDCKDIQVEHLRYHKSASPESILDEVKKSQKVFPWAEKK
jgi:hypothetical protein